MRGIGRTLALVALGLGVWGCPSQGPVEFGAVLPLTGWASDYGQAIRNGIELAHEQVQADPGKQRVKLVVIDSQTDPARAAEALDRLYGEGATAVIGGVLSVEALAMVPVADEADRVLLSPSATQPQLASGWQGGNRIAIHGTSRTESIGEPVSNGCMRAHEEDIRYLFERLPLGTPVWIVA